MHNFPMARAWLPLMGTDVNILSILASESTYKEQDCYPIPLPKDFRAWARKPVLPVPCNRKPGCSLSPWRYLSGVTRAYQHDKRNIPGLRFLFKFQFALGIFLCVHHFTSSQAVAKHNYSWLSMWNTLSFKKKTTGSVTYLKSKYFLCAVLKVWIL